MIEKKNCNTQKCTTAIFSSIIDYSGPCMRIRLTIRWSKLVPTTRSNNSKHHHQQQRENDDKRISNDNQTNKQTNKQSQETTIKTTTTTRKVDWGISGEQAVAE